MNAKEILGWFLFLLTLFSLLLPIYYFYSLLFAWGDAAFVMLFLIPPNRPQTIKWEFGIGGILFVDVWVSLIDMRIGYIGIVALLAIAFIKLVSNHI